LLRSTFAADVAALDGVLRAENLTKDGELSLVGRPGQDYWQA